METTSNIFIIYVIHPDHPNHPPPAPEPPSLRCPALQAFSLPVWNLSGLRRWKAKSPEMAASPGDNNNNGDKNGDDMEDDEDEGDDDEHDDDGMPLSAEGGTSK